MMVTVQGVTGATAPVNFFSPIPANTRFSVSVAESQISWVRTGYGSGATAGQIKIGSTTYTTGTATDGVTLTAIGVVEVAPGSGVVTPI